MHKDWLESHDFPICLLQTGYSPIQTDGQQSGGESAKANTSYRPEAVIRLCQFVLTEMTAVLEIPAVQQ
jgi:hypothetical protein